MEYWRLEKEGLQGQEGFLLTISRGQYISWFRETRFNAVVFYTWKLPGISAPWLEPTHNWICIIVNARSFLQTLWLRCISLVFSTWCPRWNEAYIRWFTSTFFAQQESHVHWTAGQLSMDLDLTCQIHFVVFSSVVLFSWYHALELHLSGPQ